MGMEMNTTYKGVQLKGFRSARGFQQIVKYTFDIEACGRLGINRETQSPAVLQHIKNDINRFLAQGYTVANGILVSPEASRA